jgi:POT family proton-dependent oligopeptide transporter
MVAVSWLLVGYVLQTTGELCLSPVGLSMISKLSPKVLVSTVMGGWFLATAFSQYVAGIISQFTRVSDVIPPPIDTVNVYGEVFKQIAIAAIASGLVCLVLAPLLHKWMHGREPETAAPAPA